MCASSAVVFFPSSETQVAPILKLPQLLKTILFKQTLPPKKYLKHWNVLVEDFTEPW